MEGLFSHRIVPQPKWITTNWSEKADGPYRELAKLEREILSTGWPAKSKVDWKTKAKQAYDAWYSDSQNCLKIYKATLYLVLARQVDPTYLDDSESRERGAVLNRGWEFLDNPPRSFEFVRRGYAFCVGDGDRANYGDIAKKILERDPTDRMGVVGAMCEYEEGRRGAFATWMFETAERYRKTSTKWRPWDNRTLGRCYQIKSEETYKRADLLRAIELAEEAIRLTPERFDTQPMIAWVKYMRERQLPKMKG